VPGAIRPAPLLAYVHEGLVRGTWNESPSGPGAGTTAVVAGDGRWVGADAFKFDENLIRYAALTSTQASVVPLDWLQNEAPRALLVDALRSVSLNWCTSASVLTLGGDALRRRVLFLLFELCRLHPRPELEVRQCDLADMLGIARQTLQPVLKRLERAGLISLGYAEIVVTDASALSRELGRPTNASKPDHRTSRLLRRICGE
jgi:hypothetical protein